MRVSCASCRHGYEIRYAFTSGKSELGIYKGMFGTLGVPTAQNRRDFDGGVEPLLVLVDAHSTT